MTERLNETLIGAIQADGLLTQRYALWRRVKDVAFRWLVNTGGLLIIAAIGLIFVYLLYVVLPLFRGASAEAGASYRFEATEPLLALVLDEYGEIGFSVAADGRYRFFRADSGDEIESGVLLDRVGVRITAAATTDPERGIVALADSEGGVRLLRLAYDLSYPDGKRQVTPRLEYPYGAEPIVVGEQPLLRLAARADEDAATLITADAAGRLQLIQLERRENQFTGDIQIERTTSELPEIPALVRELILDPTQRSLFVLDAAGILHLFDLTDKAAPQPIDAVDVRSGGAEITALGLLSGGLSLVLGDDSGRLEQWFAVRDEHNRYTLRRVREFPPLATAITGIVPEYYRKGFLAFDRGGSFGIYHATAERQLEHQPLAHPMAAAALAPRADRMLAVHADQSAQLWAIDNRHPEVSWRALWGKVWYESRAEPEFIWQSSSASADFEPKYSLTPLAFGSLKAAFYSMLFAVPLAILGAMYTAYFMNPRLRHFVKPSIEIMAALPTVILGFLAGLWLAPFIERNLLGTFLLLLSLPLACLFGSLLWARLPQALTQRTRAGWESLLLLPLFLVTGWLCLRLGIPLEAALFDGNLPHWVTEHLGLGFDQRNSLVVGIAVGVAVIPTIFSISEDAIYEVPRHLTVGSLALGATRWQTMLRVVLLTASPGIFSAVMIGLGRAVGETMIVLMATGNTPIMDMNIFQGLRALSANIAVEMPEAEVDSTHFRILFLAALVLFAVTFLFNTVAELVRQRLRQRYSNL